MVYALREAHRVLRPEGLAIDLRPAAIHRRVGIVLHSEYKLRWVMKETFQDDRAADRAIVDVLNNRIFKAVGQMRIPCYRVMDTIDDFREWLTDFVERNKCTSHEWLVRRLERALAASAGTPGIVVSAPLVLRTLKKRDARRSAAIN